MLTFNNSYAYGNYGRSPDYNWYITGNASNKFNIILMFKTSDNFSSDEESCLIQAANYWASVLRDTKLPAQKNSKLYFHIGDTEIDNPLGTNYENKGIIIVLEKFTDNQTDMLAYAAASSRRVAPGKFYDNFVSIGSYVVNTAYTQQMLTPTQTAIMPQYFWIALHEMCHLLGVNQSTWQIKKTGGKLRRSFIVSAGDQSTNEEQDLTRNVFYSTKTGTRTDTQIGEDENGSPTAVSPYAYNEMYGPPGGNSFAVAEYNKTFGTELSAIPLENNMSSGSYATHWDEGDSIANPDTRRYYNNRYPGAPTLNRELMTPVVENSGVPLAVSKITLGALQDLGWVVDYDGAHNYEPYTHSLSAVEQDIFIKYNNFRLWSKLDYSSTIPHIKRHASNTFFSYIPNDAFSVKIDGQQTIPVTTTPNEEGGVRHDFTVPNTTKGSEVFVYITVDNQVKTIKWLLMGDVALPNSLILGSNTYYYEGSLVSGQTKLYTGEFSDAPIAPNSTGTDDVNEDGDDDSWTITGGTISWSTKVVYDKTITLNSNIYYYAGTLTSGTTVLYNKQYSSATVIASLSGIDTVPQNNNLQNWQTNEDGVLSWSLKIVYPQSIELDTTYYYEGNLRQNLPLYLTQGSAAIQPANKTGVKNINGDSKIDDWTINNGLLTWIAKIVYFNSINLKGTTYYYDGEAYRLQAEEVPMYTSQNSDALLVNRSLSGIDELPKPDTTWLNYWSWRINSSGIFKALQIVNYVSVNLVNSNGIYLYYLGAENPISGQTVLYTDPKLETIARNFSGRAYFSPDPSNEKEWATNNQGVLTWSTRIIFDKILILNGTPCYYQGTLQSGITTLHTGQATGYIYSFVPNSTGTDDVDGNSYLDDWTVTNGVITWSVKPIYTKSITLKGNQYFYAGELLPTGTDLYLTQYPGSARPTITDSGTQEINGDELYIEDWNLSNGVLTWDTKKTYLNSIQLNNTTYYYTGDLTSGTTIIYASEYPYATAIADSNGVDTISGSNSKWSTNSSGVLSWIAVNSITISGSTYYYVNSLESGVTVLYVDNKLKVKATVSTGEDFVDADLDVDVWQINNLGVLSWTAKIVYGNQILVNNKTYYYTGSLDSTGTILRNNPYSSAPKSPDPNASGVKDIDEDSNDDNWTITEGILSWTMKEVYNKSIVLDNKTYYYTGELAAQGTNLFKTRGSGALAADNAMGVDDVETDGNLDNWTISEGILTWSLKKIYEKTIVLNSKTYYYTGILSSSGTNLYEAQGSGAQKTLDVFSDLIADVNGDGNEDSWSISGGTLTWEMVIEYPNSVNLNGSTYYYNTPNAAGTTLYLSQGTAAVQATDSDTGNMVDIDGDSNLDSWILEEGILSWTMKIIHDKTITINSNTYYYDGSLVSGETVLYVAQGSGSNVVADSTGDYDIDEDGNIDEWQIADGVISWNIKVVYENSIVLNGTERYYTGNLVSSTSVIYDTQYSGAAKTASIDGIDSIEGFSSKWSTNSNGIITWNKINLKTLNTENYYYTGNLTSGITVLYKDSTLQTLAQNVQGTDMVDSDNNLDDWQTNQLGVISWTTKLAYEHEIFVNNKTYYYNGNLNNFIGMVLYNEQGSGAERSTDNATGVQDIDLDGNLDDWTIVNGLLRWSEKIIYDQSIIFNGETVLWYKTADFSSTGTDLYLQQGSGASKSTDTMSGTMDIDVDGNLDNWYVNDGVLTWEPIILYPNYITARGVRYYYEGSLVSGETQLYTSDKTSAVKSEDTIAGTQDDIDGDANIDEWFMIDGIITWNTKVVYPNYITLNSVKYYYADSLLSTGTPVYTSFGSGASASLDASGLQDIDGDTNDDAWSVTDGILTWSMYLYYDKSISLSNKTYYYRGTINSAGTNLYEAQGSGAPQTTDVVSGSAYIEPGDPNIDDWSIQSGTLTWTMKIIYDGIITLNSTQYYYSGPISSIGTELYVTQGSGAVRSNVSGQGTSDIQDDGLKENWTATNGTVQWVPYYGDFEEIYVTSNPSNKFNITLLFHQNYTFSTSEKNYLKQAAEYWASVLKDNVLPSEFKSTFKLKVSNTNVQNPLAKMTGIYIVLEKYDGVAETVYGQALNPDQYCYPKVYEYRQTTNLPLVGNIIYNKNANGLIATTKNNVEPQYYWIALYQMCHVLGFGLFGWFKTNTNNTKLIRSFYAINTTLQYNSRVFFTTQKDPSRKDTDLAMDFTVSGQPLTISTSLASYLYAYDTLGSSNTSRAVQEYNDTYSTNLTSVPVMQSSSIDPSLGEYMPGSRWFPAMGFTLKILDYYVGLEIQNCYRFVGFELMAGVVGARHTPSIVSSITVGSLQDIGWTVDMSKSQLYTPFAHKIAYINSGYAIGICSAEKYTPIVNAVSGPSFVHKNTGVKFINELSTELDFAVSVVSDVNITPLPINKINNEYNIIIPEVNYLYIYFDKNDKVTPSKKVKFIVYG